MFNLTLHHIDTCLPDYFSGDSRPFMQIPVCDLMTSADIKTALLNELSMGAIGGNLDYGIVESDLFDHLAKQAIDDFIAFIEDRNGKEVVYFSDIDFDDSEDYCDSIYAYFVLTN